MLPLKYGRTTIPRAVVGELPKNTHRETASGAEKGPLYVEGRRGQRLNYQKQEGQDMASSKCGIRKENTGTLSTSNLSLRQRKTKGAFTQMRTRCQQTCRTKMLKGAFLTKEN